MNVQFTNEELEVLSKTSDLLDSFNELPSVHADDVNDFKFHINALQNIILARAGQKVFNQQTRSYASWERKYELAEMSF